MQALQGGFSALQQRLSEQDATIGHLTAALQHLRPLPPLGPIPAGSAESQPTLDYKGALPQLAPAAPVTDTAVKGEGDYESSFLTLPLPQVSAAHAAVKLEEDGGHQSETGFSQLQPQQRAWGFGQQQQQQQQSRQPPPSELGSAKDLPAKPDDAAGHSHAGEISSPAPSTAAGCSATAGIAPFDDEQHFLQVWLAYACAWCYHHTA